MNIQTSLVQYAIQGVSELYNATLTEDQISLQETRKEFAGHLTLVTFPIIRFSKKSPEQTGQELGAYLQEKISHVRDFNVVKGFLNLVISSDYWFERMQTEISDEHYGFFPPNGKRLMVEYSSPNTNKPLHLGHVRNNLLGFSVAEILKAYGYEVIKANLVNDRGIHICKSMLSWKLFGNGETPESSGLKGDHLVGKYYVLFDQAYKKEIEEGLQSGLTEEEAKKNAPLMKEAQSMLRQWELGDPEVVGLWKMMNDWVYAGFSVTYQTMGVDFDKYYYESDTYLLGKDIIQEGLDKGVFFKKEDNSVWIDLSADGLDEKLVLRGDGTSVYITQDLGTAQLKYDEFKMDHSIYVVGNEQDYHFKVLFLILEKLGKSWASGLYHLSYGMVDLPSGRMKSREGTVVDADDLMQEMVETAEGHTIALGKIEGFSEGQAKALYEIIGLGALKYFLLKVDPKKRMMFNPEESIQFQGNTAPFVQYTHARIAAILRKADQLGIDYLNSHLAQTGLLHEVESELVYLLADFPERIKLAAETYSPSLIAQYVYDLAKEYNRFYTELSVFNENDAQVKTFRVALSYVVARTIKKGMGLLGIAVP